MKKTPDLEHKSSKTYSFSLRTPKRAIRKPQLMILLLVFTTGLLAFVKPLVSGLDQAEPMGVYLNGNLPANVTPDLTIEEVIPGDFDKIMSIVPEPHTSNLFITDRFGKIFVVDENNPTNFEVFLDISSKIWSPSGTIHGSTETGIFIMTFHPEFNDPTSPNRNYFYIYYVSSTNGKATTFLSRFTRPDGATTADPNSEMVLIKQYVDKPWHRGGGLLFGNDGFLYLAIGDFNKKGWTQLIHERFVGGVIRIDVDMDPSRSHPIVKTLQSFEPLSFSGNYFVPNDNPWLDPTGASYEEYYALGLRNPHRMTLDSLTGEIYLGNVGQGGSSALEEVDKLIKGANYGWPFKEGSDFTGDPVPSSIIGTVTDALYAYPHANGENCVIGGTVYRGTTFPNLYGKYIFGDYGSSRIYALDVNGNDPVEEIAFFSPGKQTTIINGHDNELYIANTKDNASIYKMVGSGGSLNPPQLLSQVGVFSDINDLIPNPGVIPYTVNTSLWSDGADKKRWVAIPNDGSHNTAAEQVNFSEMEEWEFPIGTVIIKHFELQTDENDPTAIKRLETRFLVRANDGSFYGMTYKWLPDGSDAELLPGSFQEDITINLAGGGTRVQTWQYPSRSDCFVCHTDVSGRVLGLKTRQQNGDLFYPSTGNTGNQLESWNHIGIFDPAISVANIPGYLTSKAITDTSASVEFRVRSYLDANCSSCHRPGGAGRAEFDMRLNIPLASQRLINEPVYESLGIAGAAVVVPQDTGASILYQRIKSTDPNIIMPPLARTMTDQVAKDLIADWIMNMPIPNREPIADLTATPISGIFPLLVNFDASGSSDPDNDTLTYTWDFGDNTQGAGITSAHTYSQIGNYTAVLTVDDGRGGTAQDSVTIIVGDGSIVITPVADQHNIDGETVDLQVVVTGGHGALNYVATGLPPGLTIEPDSGKITGTLDPAASNNSPYAVVVTVDDADSDTTDRMSTSFNWTIDTVVTTITDVWLESECAIVGSNWTETSDASASGGAYLASPGTNSNTTPSTDPANHVVFNFLVTDAGQYKIFGRAIAPTDNDDSFWVQANGGTWVRWNKIAPSSSWNWDQVHEDRNNSQVVLFDLVAGSNTITFAGRENGSSLDKIFVSLTGDTPVGAGASSSNCIGGTPISVGPIANQTNFEGDLVSLQLVASGGDGPLSFTGTGLPPGLSLNDTTGLIDGRIDTSAVFQSPFSVNIIIDDTDTTNLDQQIVNFTWTVLDSSVSNEDIWLEMECASVGSNWTEVSDGTASGGFYTLSPAQNYNSNPSSDTANHISFSFSLGATGQYKIFGRTIAPNGNDDSFWVRANGGTWVRWNNIQPSTSWNWSQVHEDRNNNQLVLFDMVAGINTVDIAGRENGAKIDKLFITQNGDAPIGEGLPGSNCVLPSIPVTVNSISTQTNLEGTNANLQVVASGGDAALSYSALGLPPGLSIDANTGLISGQIDILASVNSPYSVNVEVDDLDGDPTDKANTSFDWIISPTPVLITVNPISNQVNTERDTVSVPVIASGGNAALTYSATGLPQGVSIDANTGLISGVLDDSASVNSPYGVTVEVDDSDADSTDKESVFFTWEVTFLQIPINLTALADQSHTESDVISLPVVASGGNGALSYNASNLPDGLAINSTTGEISGQLSPTSSNNSPYLVEVVVDDADADSTDRQITTFNWTVADLVIPIVLDPITDQNNTEQDIVSLQVVASGGDGARSYSASNLPSGLSIDPVTGEISGQLSSSSSNNSPYLVEVMVDDADADSTDRQITTFSWTVADLVFPIVLDPISDQSNTEKDVVSLQVVASGGDSTLVYTASNLPGGLSINSSTGEISGEISDTASVNSPYLVQIEVDDSDTDLTDKQSTSFNWTVADLVFPIVLDPISDQSNTEEDVVSLQVVASGGDSTLVYTASNLPGGLSINSSTGEISGEISDTASVNSPYLVQIEVDDSDTDLTDKQSTSFSWTVADLVFPIVLDPISDQSNTEKDVISLQVVASGGDSTLVYTAVNLPAGLSINASTGEISGEISDTASVNSPYLVQIEVDDSDTDLTDKQSTSFSWTVADFVIPIVLDAIPDQSNLEGDAVALQVNASGGDNTLVYAASNLPAGLSINTSTGEITGNIATGAHANSPYLVQIEVDDSDADVTDKQSTSFSWSVDTLVTSVTNVWLEAECASVGSNWTEISDVNASGGLYLQSPGSNFNSSPSNDPDNQVSFEVTVTDGGQYKIFGRTIAPNGNDDSFWVRANGGTWVRWNNIAPSMNWNWDQVHEDRNNNQVVLFDLTVGTNTLTFAGRETGTSLDKVFVTLAGDTPIGEGESATNCIGGTPITVSPIADQTNMVGDIVSLQVVANGGDGSLSYSASGLPAGVSINPLTGEISGSPDTSATTMSPHLVSITVDDTDLISADAKIVSFSWFVYSPGSGNDEVWLEAECAATGSGWSEITDVDASNGSYMLAPNKNYTSNPANNLNERITFTFTVSTTGQYKMFGRTIAPNTGDDSFWVRANGGTWVRWNQIQPSTSFNWSQVHEDRGGITPVLFDLVVGSNTVEIAGREGGSILDKIYLTLTGVTPSGLGSPATNCGGGARDGISEPAPMFSLYPNPNRGSFLIQADMLPLEGPVEVSVYNLAGQEILKKTFKEETMKIDLGTNQVNGLYLVRVNYQGMNWNFRMIKE